MLRLHSDVFRAEVKTPGGTVLYTRRGGEITLRLAYGAVYGLGERFDALNQKGRRVVCRVEEKFCFQGSHSYCPAPYFRTDTGFGFYADTCAVTTFDFREDGIHITLPENADAVLFSGTPESILREYMNLFGAAVLPPDWVFLPWVSANRWSSRRDAEDVLDKLRRCDFPAGVLVLEAWSDEATFYIWNGAKYTPVPDGRALRYEDFDFSASPWQDPKELINKLHAAGLHLLLWQVPVYKKQGAEEPISAQNELDRADAAERGLCVKNADGSPYTIPEGHWFAGSMVPDFTNPDTVQSWFDKRRYLLDMGVDGFKTDGGEFIYAEDARFADGSRGTEGINRYARDYTGAYRRFVGEERILFSRAGYAGQHTVPLHWAGDQQSQNAELASVLRAGLSAGESGILFWGFDLAGFAGALPTLDLYRRATQTACFCPVMQWHSEPDGGQFRELMPGGEGNNERSPWNMAEAYGAPDFPDEMRYWHKLRVKLQPYLLQTARECVRRSAPMLRSLAYAFPGDETARGCEDEFLLGDSLLVAPLLEENAERRTVYLPEGEWIGFFDRCTYSGRQTVIAGGDGKLPVFFRPACRELAEIETK